MTVDIFISYSRIDRDFVADLVARFDQEWIVWWDADLICGSRFEPEILKKIAEASVFIVVVSSNSLKSCWVDKEIRTAIDSDRRVIPILKEKLDLPETLSQLHACNLTNWERASESVDLKTLLRDLSVILEREKPFVFDYIRQRKASNQRNLIKGFAPWLTLGLVVVGVCLYLALQPSANSESKSSSYAPAQTVKRSWREIGYPKLDETALRFSREKLADSFYSPHSSDEREKIVEEKRMSAAIDEPALRAELLNKAQRSEYDAIKLSEMLEHGVGGDRDPTKAQDILKTFAAEEANVSAKFNYGLRHVLQIYPNSDPVRGIEIIDSAFRGGFRADEAVKVIDTVCCRFNDAQFAVTLKQIRLLEDKPAARALDAILKLKGISIPPCGTDCMGQAEMLARGLRETGGSNSLAELVETAVKNARGRADGHSHVIRLDLSGMESAPEGVSDLHPVTPNLRSLTGGIPTEPPVNLRSLMESHFSKETSPLARFSRGVSRGPKFFVPRL